MHINIPGVPPLRYFTLSSEGNEHGYHTWKTGTAVKRFTNAFVFDPSENKILLGLKKRGFGKGIYNGFGGKVDPGETVGDAALRELEVLFLRHLFMSIRSSPPMFSAHQEESHITAPLEPCGLLVFVGAGHEYTHHITVFSAKTWQGDPTETDEMRPEWFAFPSLDIPSKSIHSDKFPPFPYDLMWKDDPLWMPHLLKSEYFIARVDYGPVPIPQPGQKVEPVLDGTGYLVDGVRVEAGMQKWVVGTMDKEEWESTKPWEV